MEKIAILSYQYKEFFYANLWQNFYGKQFGYENLFVIVDKTKDTAQYLYHDKVNLINHVPQYHQDVYEHVKIVMDAQNKLLQKYDVVVMAEADQYFIPDPYKYINLKDYLSKNKYDYIKVSGWNVIHDIYSEDNYDYSKKILQQRKYWYKDVGQEDKMLIIRKPVISYDVGFHRSVPDVERDPDLYNIHLHEFDFKICNFKRHVHIENKNWHPSTGKNKMVHHVTVIDDESKLHWFDRALDQGMQLIPERFKDVI